MGCFVAILGTHSAQAWTSILTQCVSLLDSEDINVRSEALNCLSAVIVSVKTAVLSRLPTFLPTLLDQIQDIFSKRSAESMAVLAAVEALEVVVSFLASFISPYLAKILNVVAACGNASVKSTVKDTFAVKVTKIRNVLTEAVPFRVMFGAFSASKDLQEEITVKSNYPMTELSTQKNRTKIVENSQKRKSTMPQKRQKVGFGKKRTKNAVPNIWA